MSLVVTAIGALILAISLVGIAFGVYMSTHPKTQEAGKLFAIWWVTGVATALGVLMRDSVTFLIAMICFAVAGAVLLIKSGSTSRPSARRKSSASRTSSTRTTRENRTRGNKPYKRKAS